ncbi:g-protein alpha subunit [Phaffia rhodozyma]|uniref:G-protein alpha subunit n=1 Tax=Phaffia rhodozyma TaxID=264483 RepID=A0A0F7SLB6_PHARH|nr:g-protein alpha subunit [Phaffia rhodozyma]
MGCAASTEDSAAKARNEAIENQIKKDRQNLQNEIKMLLLGAGESGKSTVLKQMKLIHQGSYKSEEREAYKEIVFSNTCQSMKVLVEALTSMHIPLGNPANQRHCQTIISAPHQIEGDTMPGQISEAVRCLWADAGIRAVFRRKNEIQLNDSAQYYFDHIDEVGSGRYLPSDQDVLRSRVRSTGITETTFRIGDMTYRLFDVGGQRSERKKWIHCFENVTAIVFLVAISEYDQKLYEDESVNRMQEALTLFESICNSRWFVRTSIILFLNKIDLFAEKLPFSPLGDYFEDYKGGDDYDKACEYILDRFVSLNASPDKSIYCHYTSAVDTNQIKLMLLVSNLGLLNLGLLDLSAVNLRDCGLL